MKIKRFFAPNIRQAIRMVREEQGPDEQADEAHTLIEENARLRELLSQLSDLIRRNGVHPR